jgi:pyruvate/2-oxoglutarate/acetoin dehydrogenase E1 component
MTTGVTTVLRSLNQALHDAMEAAPEVFVVGEDILDPYGGAFKVTKGLSTRFPDRVLTTPISEAAIVGVAAGMAMRGLRPVAEIMFGDFVLLAADQIVNHASKFRWMYNNQVRVPLVLRAPMGGRRGYGPTHSQSLEKMFLGVPGLRVVAVNTLADAGTLLRHAIADDDPVLFIEHKLLYSLPQLVPGQGELTDYTIDTHGRTYPTCVLRFRGQDRADLTLACYGHVFELARQAALTLLLEHELFAEIVVLTQLSPFELAPVHDSVGRTGRLVTAEEGGLTAGWGAEVASRLVSALPAAHLRGVRRVAARDLPIANSRVLEDTTLPSVDDIVSAGTELVAATR